MFSRKTSLSALLLLALVLSAGPAPGAAPPVRKPTPAQIARWVKELGAEAYLRNLLSILKGNYPRA